MQWAWQNVEKMHLVKYEVTPDPLEVHGDSVAITVKGTYPPKYFAKKVDLTVTPVVKTPTGEHAFKPITEVGEKSKTPGNKINQKAGGSFTYSDKIAYSPDMRGGRSGRESKRKPGQEKPGLCSC